MLSILLENCNRINFYAIAVVAILHKSSCVHVLAGCLFFLGYRTWRIIIVSISRLAANCGSYFIEVAVYVLAGCFLVTGE